MAPINDSFNGLWSNVELFWNDRLISYSNNTHGYTSMISHLIHNSEESLHSERSLRLLYKDKPGQMDYLNAAEANLDELIKGFYHIDTQLVVDDEGAVREEEIEDHGINGLHTRFLFSHISKKVRVMGSLSIALFEQKRYLPNGVNLKLRFHRQRELFTMMTGDGNGYKIDLEKAFMLMRKVKPSSGVQLGHTAAMMKMPATFPVTYKETKVIAMSKDVNTFVKYNILLGQLPKRVVIAMVDGEAFAEPCISILNISNICMSISCKCTRMVNLSDQNHFNLI